MGRKPCVCNELRGRDANSAKVFFAPSGALESITMKVQFSQDKKSLVITIGLTAPSESKSGKTLLVASTHGAQATGLTVQDKPVIVSLNAYIKADD